jgi:cytosine permease
MNDTMFTLKVKEQDRQGWGAVAVITAGQWFGIAALMVGGILGEGLSLVELGLCALVGALVLLGCASFMGIQSSTSGLPSTILSAEALGLMGARCIPALLIGVTSIGWFGVQAGTHGASFSAMAAKILGISVPAWAATLFWGLVMSLSAMHGYRVLRFFYYICVPALSLIVAYALAHTVFFSEADSLALLSAWNPATPMSYVRAITIIVGAWAMGAYVVGDYCRYAETPRKAVLGISAGVIAVPAILVSGAIFRIVTGSSDITAVLDDMGYPAISLLYLVMSAWSINVMNAYFGGIALATLLGQRHLTLTTAFTGLAGTVLGAAGILSFYTGFLSLLSSLVPPVIGTLVGSAIMGAPGRRGKAEDGQDNSSRSMPAERPANSGFHRSGIIAYGAGALTAWLTTAALPFFIPPLNGIIAAAAAYILLEKLLPSSRR